MIRNSFTLLMVIVMVYISYKSEIATDVRPHSDKEFSALSAYEYLENIAKEPHPIGSVANQRVKDYLVKTLTDLGLEVEVETGYTYTSWKPSYNKMAYVENIVATLPGSDPTAKKVMLAGHYDSVVEGPGAADDGYAVACMIETARLLKGEDRASDLVLLITDGEEYGLLGAQYHTEQNDLSNIGVVLNYEARGAEGPGIAFEWSENNAWLVAEMAKCYRRPIANSLSYEIYKRMPNASDFTVFREEKLAGINHAFIDGFSYYHHPQDDLEHVSMNSIQHTGENMYRAAKHFTNYNFDFQNSSHGGNATFFNFFGTIIYYPAAINIWILILGILLCVGACSLTFRRIHGNQDKINENQITAFSIGRSLTSILAVLGLIILCGGIAFAVASAAKAVYPQYSTFYSYQYYNHEWYLIAGIGSSILICGWIGHYLFSRIGHAHLLLGLLFLLALLSAILYYFAPTGAYIMMWPMIIIAFAILIQRLLPDKYRSLSFVVGLCTIFLLVGMWTQFSHTLFLAFSLSALPGAIIPTVITCIAAQILLPSLWRDSRAMMMLGAVLLLMGIVVAHITSKPTAKHPLLANLFFTYDSQSDMTYIGTSDPYLNDGHTRHLSGSKSGRLDRHLPYSQHYDTTDVDVSPYRSSISIDSISPQKSTVHLKHPKRATMLHLYIPDIGNFDSVYVNGAINKVFKAGANGSYYSPLYGIGLDSISVDVVKRDPSLASPLHINMKYMELPIEDNLPENSLRDGAHTTISEWIEL